jgi:hypothetical protein
MKTNIYIKNAAQAAVVLVISSFLFGTIVWAAVDIFALYSENQFTGRMRSFDVEYWDAVKGSGFVIFTAAVANVLTGRVTSLFKNEE